MIANERWNIVRYLRAKAAVNESLASGEEPFIHGDGAPGSRCPHPPDEIHVGVATRAREHGRHLGRAQAFAEVAKLLEQPDFPEVLHALTVEAERIARFGA